MDYLIKEFDLNILKANHMLEMALDIYSIKNMEFNILCESTVLTEEEADIVKDEHKASFLTKLSDFFEKLRNAIVELAKKIIQKIKNTIEEKKINDKLKNIKIQLIKNKEKAGEKITIFDSIRYKKNYTEYINESVRSIRKIRNTKFTTIRDYMNTIQSEEKRLSDLKLKLGLNKIEEFELTTSVLQATDYTLKESLNMVNEIAKIETEAKLALLEAEKCTEDDITEDVSENPNTVKVNFIKKVATDISTTTKDIISRIPAGAWRAVSIIGTAIAAVGAIDSTFTVLGNGSAQRAAAGAAVAASGLGVFAYADGKVSDKKIENTLKDTKDTKKR